VIISLIRGPSALTGKGNFLIVQTDRQFWCYVPVVNVRVVIDACGSMYPW
jgi:hypothetical protein